MTEVKIPDAGGDETMTMVDVGGLTQPLFLKTAPETKGVFDNVPNFKFRDDDLMLCSFAKTGTNWMFEILMMILKKSAERVKASKLSTMLECVSAEEADMQPSPRVVNCHYPLRYLPITGMKAKQIKTVLCLRNPKDTAVSYYNHMKGMKTLSYNGKWENWLPVYLQGKLEYGKYTDYVTDWQRLLKDEPGFPLHVMYYEDLKVNGKKELNKLLKFLDVELDETLRDDIIDMCGFQKMAEEKGKNATLKEFVKENFNLFRKGQVGDWKNWFTVAQNEIFDDIWEKETKDLDTLTFKYTQDNV